jgi:hypothetical protein
LPSFAKSGWLPDGFLTQGLFGVELLRPQQLFGLTGIDEISHCLFWSFLANIGAYVGVSLLRPPMVAEATQATVFVDALKESGPVGRCSGAGGRRSATCRNWSAVFSVRRRRKRRLPPMPAGTA